MLEPQHNKWAAEEESGALALPPIPLEVAVQGLMVADQALDHALDRVWTITEGQLADAIEGTLKSTMESLHTMLQSTEDEEGRRALARDYLKAKAEMEDMDVEGMELGMLPPLSEAELTEGIGATRAFLQDVGDTLLSFSRDDVEEISDVILSASRVGLQLLQGATHRALKTLLPKGEEEGEAEATGATGATGGAIVEEASEAEIAEYYRSRGLEPPAPAVDKKEDKQPAAKSEHVAKAAAPPSARPGGRRRFNQPRPRVLWRPLTPQVVALAKETLPQELRAHPFKTAGVVACVLPLSGVVLFCLPGVLVADHFVLQKLYGRYGPWVEEAVDDVVQMARLGFVVSRLSIRQVLRVTRRQIRNAQADPGRAVHDAGAWAWDAATHPVATAKAAFGLGKRGVEVIAGLGRWLRDELMGMRAAQAGM